MSTDSPVPTLAQALEVDGWYLMKRKGSRRERPRVEPLCVEGGKLYSVGWDGAETALNDINLGGCPWVPVSPRIDFDKYQVDEDNHRIVVSLR